MLETILFAFLFARIKGYKVKPLFKIWCIYPPLIFTVYYIFLNIKIILGYYGAIQYASIIETFYILSFIPLILKLKLYKSAIWGSLAIFTGSLLNKIAMFYNGGKMPVFPSLSYITGYVKPDSFTKVNDIHILGDSNTQLKFLTDIFDLGYSILSVGDIFIRLFTFIILYNSIKTMKGRATSYA